ncbi:MAG: DEAD/DEAH box helicase family protein [Thermovenabulum sp.]|uniref:DEAD/DEAH box helicase family protein n=1 Tax=Thermovenabulum sp. TaxID=3100335 RepID=UPI003C7A6CD4
MDMEKYLVLSKYFLSLFGVEDFRQLPLKNIEERIDDGDETTPFMKTLMSLKGIKFCKDDLLRYDQNIQEYVRNINRCRGNVVLKYFQYLPVLFTEIFLDQLKNNKVEFLNQLNEFLNQYRNENEIDIPDFELKDLNKLAFWMATGSGKTLIMHINYIQFLKYRPFEPDNILLITPNEGLSKQHFDELQKSDIPCRIYDGNLNSGFHFKNEVLIIEITKLVDEKKDGGITLPISAFEGRSLIFVDEGHKGKASEDRVWVARRAKLAENGFVFEYSATFGQILSERNKEILEEYSKSIIFDYSYKYFYLDGYGKDFFVINVKNSEQISEDHFSEIMFVANLLSFYEQVMFYQENKRLAEEYNLEKPLWIFVGTTVNKEESDILQIVGFLNKVIKEENWLKEKVNTILEGKAGLKNDDGEDVFKEKFKLLKEKGVDLNDLYNRVFNGKGKLNISEIKNAEGEFGLRVGDNDYFGVINVGGNDFKKRLEEKGFEIQSDFITDSLFDYIKHKASNLNILIGAKKFIEGWDTWRVSSMGLLNIGSGQGPQIIQLFGRGVRLKGKDMSLKRSGDPRVAVLETLNIFGIKADYLSRFLEAIRKEEVEYENVLIPVKYQHKEKWKNLYVIGKREDKKFEESKVIMLEPDETVHVSIDLTPIIKVYSKTNNTEIDLDAKIEHDTLDLKRYTTFLNWERIFFEITEHKKLKKYWNLVFDKNKLREIISAENNYKVVVYKGVFDKLEHGDISKLEDIAVSVLKRYIDAYYRKKAKRFETEQINNYVLDEKTGQLMLPFICKENSVGYLVQIDKREKELIKKVKKLIKDFEKLLDEKYESDVLPRIVFESHLFVPVLLKKKIKKEDKIKFTPEGLVESEIKFLKDLRKFIEENKEKFKDIETYLLRNFPKIGVGFQLTWAGFYPDFVMWLKKGNYQIIVFIDPKGLEHDKSLDCEKIVFAGTRDAGEDVVTIKTIERRLNNPNIRLESFILSATSYKDLVENLAKKPSKSDYEKNHVLFIDDNDWCEKLFNSITV